MEHAKELILQTVSTILFCAAITLLFHQARAYLRLTEQLKETYTQENVLYQSRQKPDKNTAEESYSDRAELTATLFQPLEYDLEIDGRLISRYEFTMDQITDYVGGATQYQKQYCYDSCGRVTRIIYKSVESMALLLFVRGERQV